MADITWTDVTNAASALSVVNADFQTLILSLVNGTGLDASQFRDGESGDELKFARIYLAAHLGQLSSTLGATSGVVESEKMGDLARTFRTATTTNPEIVESTTWGQLYLLFIRRGFARLPVVC